MATFDVFISYSSLDVRIAQGFDMLLRRGGYTTWLDGREMRAGEQVPEALRAALRSCRLLCAVITPNYGKTWYTRMEAELMRSREGALAPVRVIPCLIEGGVPAFLGERSYVDFRTNWQRAEAQLLAALGNHKKVQDERGTAAKIGFGLAAGALAAWAFSGESDEEVAARRERRGALLGLAKHHALGHVLAARGIPVPAKKADRVDAVLDNVPMVEALDELFSLEDMKAICKHLEVPVGRSKDERIRNILGER